ncbi:MAG TPA: glycosyltransferase family 1 protein [Cyanophyceae cyanobacterium]
MTKPLRIALIMQGGLNWVGGTEYIKNIIYALASQPADIQSTFELCLIVSKTLDDKLYEQVQPYLNQVFYQEDDLSPINLKNRIYWKILRTFQNYLNPQLELFLEEQKFDFVYPFFTTRRAKTRYRTAAWIPDLQHKILSEFCTKSEIQARDRSYGLIAKYASTVVMSSQSAQSDLIKFFPESTYKSRVLTFKTSAPDPWYEGDPHAVQKIYSLPERFFIVSNQFWQHKNHLTVFKALKLLQERAMYPIVVCTGHLHDYRQPDYANVILKTIHQLDLSRQVYLLGLIPKIDQIQLMRRSLAVIQPSLFEGWSTVVEDARCLGKQIILSNFPVHLEQNPPNSVFFDGHSPEALADCMATWWEQLTPGPDLEKEAIAKENNLKEVQAFGKRFLEIAGQAIS